MGVTHPFSDGRQVEVFRQIDKRAHEYPVVRAVGQSLHETAIELDHVNFECLQIPERRIAGTEVVNRDTRPKRAYPADKAHALFNINKCSRLGKLNDQSRCHIFMGFNKGDKVLQSWPVRRGHARNVERQTGPAISGERLNCQLKHAPVEPPHQPQLLCNRNEVAGRYDLTLWPLDPHQALMHGGLAIQRMNDRLISNHDAILIQGCHNLITDENRALAQRIALRRVRIGREIIAPILFRAVQRLFGAHHRFLACTCVLRQCYGPHCDADTYRPISRRNDPASRGQPQRVTAFGHFIGSTAFQYQSELVACGAPNNASGTCRFSQTAADGNDHFIGHIKTVSFVDDRQIVDGNNEIGSRRPVRSGRLLQMFRQPLTQTQTAQMPCHFVVTGGPGNIGFTQFALRYITNRAHDTFSLTVSPWNANAAIFNPQRNTSGSESVFKPEWPPVFRRRQRHAQTDFSRFAFNQCMKTFVCLEGRVFTKPQISARVARPGDFPV